MKNSNIHIRDNLKEEYSDIFTAEAMDALRTLARFNREVKSVMAARIQRRAERQQKQERIGFLDSGAVIPRTDIKVRDAREGRFE